MRTDAGVSGSAVDELFWRGEILQALFWMRGEGLGEEVAPNQLASLLSAQPPLLAREMSRLAREGYLERIDRPEGAFRLSPRGIEEGARSFREEFEGMTAPGHYECAPGCACGDPGHAGEPCVSETDGDQTWSRRGHHA